MKKSIAIATICIIMMVCTCVYAADFSDLSKNHWAYENVMSLVERGVVNGYVDGTFKPDKEVTYGEFMKLAVSAYISESRILATLEGEHWATRYINTLEFYRYMTPDTVREEQLDKPITRIDMIKLLSIIDESLIGDEYPADTEVNFTDIEFLPEEYLNYVKRVVSKGYIQGNPNGTLNPEGYLSRAEMATIITRL